MSFANIKSFNNIKRFIISYSFRNVMTLKSYEDAILKLNSLQTNVASLNKAIELKKHQKHDEENYNLRDAEKFLERIDGFNLESFDKIPVIHVSGSKGKGSTCTYTDAILREFNVKTGLFTSPHLMSVTERIKLMGIPISKQLFTKYFWEVYDALQKRKDSENDLPSYFTFLQIMAFYIFVKENVDVAIIEVGIGGQFDTTNIIRNTEIVGITALQKEHVQLLGNTLKEIAWQKSGIIKKNSYVYSMNQCEECISVINQRFKELEGKRLSVIPAFNEYKWSTCTPDFSRTSDVDKFNFSLASQLSARWLKNRKLLSKDCFKDNILITIEQRFIDAFNKCNFEGRFQKIDDIGISYFLDGAHTIDSMKICADWFSNQIKLNHSEDSINILVFNITGDRDSERILKQLHSIKFDYIFFTTNTDRETLGEQNDNFSGVLLSTQLERCYKHKEIWMKLQNYHESDAVFISPTIQNALDKVNTIKDNNPAHFNLLFTGSLHLVGGSLKVIKESMDQQKLKKFAKHAN